MADCLPSMAQSQSPVMALPKKKKKKSPNHHMTLWPIFQTDLSRNLRDLVHHGLSYHRAPLRPFPQPRVSPAFLTPWLVSTHPSDLILHVTSFRRLSRSLKLGSPSHMSHVSILQVLPTISI